LVGTYPAPTHGAEVMAAGADPDGVTGIGVRDDQAVATIVLRLRGRDVKRGGEVAVIERLHTDVVELEIPIVAVWWRRVDDQRLVGRELPVAVIVGNVGNAAGLCSRASMEGGQLVGVLAEAAGPLQKEPRTPMNEA